MGVQSWQYCKFCVCEKHEISCRPEGLDVHFKCLMLTLLESGKNVVILSTCWDNNVFDGSTLFCVSFCFVILTVAEMTSCNIFYISHFV